MTPEEQAHLEGPDTEHCSCVPHLRAEVERLRAALHVSEADADALDEEAARWREDAMTERASIVAYLRDGYLTCDRNTAAFFADCIEARHDRWKP